MTKPCPSCGATRGLFYWRGQTYACSICHFRFGRLVDGWYRLIKKGES